MNKDSGFDDKEYTATPYLKLIEDREGTTCVCYQMRIHGKLHFVKKIKPEFENDARMRAAFRKENELGFSLSHPNIPTYLFMEGIFSPEEYVVTDWIDGETLDKFIDQNPKYFSDKKNIERFISQLTDAMDYLHKHGIIHGDLKPSNIMLSRNGERVIILDLGFTVSDAHTLTGGYTYDFAAPELINGESATEAADYFSLGKIIEFIGYHTEDGLPKVIKGLKKVLTNSDISKRIRSKEEIDNFLNKKRSRWIWLVPLPLIALFIWGLVLLADKYKAPENYNTHTSTDLKEPTHPENPIYLENNQEVALEINEPSKAQTASEKEKIKAEVNRLLKLNYAPLISRIDSLTLANDFTVDGYFKLIEESGEAMKNSISDRYYYSRYPSVPKEEVIYIISNEFSDFCNKIWYPKIENYYKNLPK